MSDHAETEDWDLDAPVEPPLDLEPEGLHGVAGDWWRLIEPHTEACAAGVVATFLACAGNAFGSGPKFDVAYGQPHHCAEFVLCVGLTGEGAKNTSMDAGMLAVIGAEPEWADLCIRAAANSSLGVIDAVRDELTEFDVQKQVRVVKSPECDDQLHRSLFKLSEVASLIRKFEVKGDTLSTTYREAWDGTPLENTSKTNRCRASSYMISIVGCVTPAELLRYLDDTEQKNGFLNRFLLIWCSRSKLIDTATWPSQDSVNAVTLRLRDAIQFARAPRRITRSAAAQALYEHIHADLMGPYAGPLASLLQRSRPHIARIAMIYALLDRSSVVRVEHLLAALAVWDYSALSIQYVFGETTGDGAVDRFIRALRRRGGHALHSDLHGDLGRNWKSHDYARVVRVLTQRRMLTVEERKDSEAGRPGKVYVLERARNFVPILPKARVFAATLPPDVEVPQQGASNGRVVVNPPSRGPRRCADCGAQPCTGNHGCHGVVEQVGFDPYEGMT